MSKRKAKPTPPEGARRLKFNGENGKPYITGIPARDLEHHELIELSLQHDMSVDDFTAMLCTKIPGRQTTAGKPLYSPNKPHVCPECGKEFTVWEKLHDHALKHVGETNAKTATVVTHDENQESNPSTD